MPRHSIIFFAFSLLLGASGRLAGQTAGNPDSALQAILGGISGARLSLDEAIQAALKNSTAARRAEGVYDAASGSVRHEAGAFDPQLFFNLTYLDVDLPTASFFSGAPTLSTQQSTSTGGLRMSLPTGTELELAMNTTHLNTNSSFAFLNPEFDAFGSLTLRQPLLGGFQVSARKQLTQAERTLDAEKARYDQEVLTVRAETEAMYWDLYAAERDYAVQKLTRDRSDAFLKETELRAKTGLVGPDQVANARTFLAEQELLLLEREEQFERQSDQLASLIGVRPGGGMDRFLAADEPPADFRSIRSTVSSTPP